MPKGAPSSNRWCQLLRRTKSQETPLKYKNRFFSFRKEKEGKQYARPHGTKYTHRLGAHQSQERKRTRNRERRRQKERKRKREKEGEREIEKVNMKVHEKKRMIVNQHTCKSKTGYIGPEKN